jgi:hypothetical protein
MPIDDPWRAGPQYAQASFCFATRDFAVSKSKERLENTYETQTMRSLFAGMKEN